MWFDCVSMVSFSAHSHAHANYMPFSMASECCCISMIFFVIVVVVVTVKWLWIIDDILIIVAMFDTANQRKDGHVQSQANHKCMHKNEAEVVFYGYHQPFSTANPLLLIKNIEKMKYHEKNTRETCSFSIC